jgi:hypothetical protein
LLQSTVAHFDDCGTSVSGISCFWTVGCSWIAGLLCEPGWVSPCLGSCVLEVTHRKRTHQMAGFSHGHLRAVPQRAALASSLSPWPHPSLAPSRPVSFAPTGHALGVPGPGEGAGALRPAPIPHPTLQEEEDCVPRCCARPARQPPTQRQPPLHAVPRQCQQPQQCGQPVAQARHQANAGTGPWSFWGASL